MEGFIYNVLNVYAKLVAGYFLEVVIAGLFFSMLMGLFMAMGW